MLDPKNVVERPFRPLLTATETLLHLFARRFFLDPGGRPGPLRLRRRLRPFLAFLFGPPTAPSSPWTASCTCSRTMSRITVSRLFRRGIDSSCTRAYGTRLPYPSRDQPALDHHSRRPRSLGSALRIGHEQGRRVVLRQTLGRRVPLRRSATAQH